jgi:hypothetical protein
VKHRSTILALSAIALVLAACGNAGAAAVVGNERITDVQVAEIVEETLTAQGQPKDTPADQLTGQVLQRLVTITLVDQLAEQEGVVATQGEIDGLTRQYEAQAGGPEQVVQTFVQQNVAPSMIAPLIRLNILATKLGRQLAPTADQNGQTQAVVLALGALSEEEGTSVAPRYGTWSAAELSLGPVSDDLSIPRTR